MAEAVFSLPYNIVLHVSTVVHVPIKLFSMYIVYRYSPSNMGAMPYFILNMMAWDLLGNVFRALLHIYPEYPALCFRAYGLMILLTENEMVSHFLFVGTVACFYNCLQTSLFAFPYRYAVLKHPNLLERIKKSRVIALYVVSHTGITVATFLVYSLFIVRHEDYNFEKKPDDEQRLCCLSPRGWIGVAMGACAVLTCFLLITGMFVFYWLIKKHLASITHLYSAQTAELHRKFLRYLTLITAMCITFEQLPVIVVLLCCIFSTFSFAKELLMMCEILLYNYGVIFSVVSIVAFKPYSKAARRIFTRLLSGKVVKSQVIVVSHKSIKKSF
uniref:G_PROTEIN_RECEP_F1_2 domain-containing protein n=1 Tax=Steinernema glaseri TaxID=37863 RepID=A0A1I7Y7Y0_9BILA